MNLVAGSRITVGRRDFVMEQITADRNWINLTLHSVKHIDQQSRENRAEIDAWVKTLPWRKRISTRRRLRKLRSKR